MTAGDNTLLGRAQQGDPLAFERLLEPFAARLLMFIRYRGQHLLHSDFDEEDVLQLVLARAWELMPSFEYRGPAALYRWLASLAEGIVNDRAKYLRAKGRDQVRHLESNLNSSAPPPQPFDPATSISRAAARREEFQRAETLMRSLDPMYREVVQRHVLEAQSLREIGEQLGISKNAVWERLHRGMSRLREELLATS